MDRQSWTFRLGRYSCIAFVIAASCAGIMLYTFVSPDFERALKGWGSLRLDIGIFRVLYVAAIAGMLLGAAGFVRSRGLDRMLSVIGFTLNCLPPLVIYLLDHAFDGVH